MLQRLAQLLFPILDPHLIAQVVYGLVSNAVEAMGEGGRVAVRLEHGPDRSAIEVGDSGPGVPGEITTQIFEPFFTTKASGTGLGLSMAERIVQSHGGTLRCVPGRGAGKGGAGACFRLEIPTEAGSP